MTKRKILGFISILMGIVFLLDTQLTGAIISNSMGSSVSFFIGMILLIGGIGLILTKGRKLADETEGGMEIIITDRFSRSIGKHSIKKINKALKKIGTGRGREETLKMDRTLFSIRASGGARILYRKDAEGNIVTENYLPSHEYNRYLKEHA